MPVTRIETISDGDINIEKVGWLAPVEGIERHRLNPGDILFSHINSLERLGNCAIYRGEPPLLVHGINLLRLQLDSEIIEPELCLHYLRTNAAKTFYLETARRAIGQASINTSDIAALPIPLPPLPEQHRIATILRYQLDAVRRAREAALARLEAARALPAAFLRFAFGSEEARRWLNVRLAEACTSIQYGYTASGQGSPVGPHLLRITDIQDGSVAWHSVPYCYCSKNDWPRYRLVDGDVLVARTGGTTGKSYLIEDPPEAVFASYLIRLRSGHSIRPRYLYAFLQSDAYWNQIAEWKRGGAQPNVNARTLSSLVLSCPAPDVQDALVVRFDRESSDAARVTAVAKAEIAEIEALPQSLLRRAFAGEI